MLVCFRSEDWASGLLSCHRIRKTLHDCYKEESYCDKQIKIVNFKLGNET